MKKISDFDLDNKRVLVRCDFDVPLNTQGNILDDFRIERSIPTIEHILKRNAKLILMAHLKGPGGEIWSLAPVQERLMEYLDLSVTKAADCIGKKIEDWTQNMLPGEILLLENLRFREGEKTNDLEFGKALARLGDIYINDSFATCHRPHASLVGVPRYLPSGAGLQLEKEITILSQIRENPSHPLVAIIGGVVKEKKELMFVEKMSEIADVVLVGGLIQKAIEKEQFLLTHPEKIITPMKGDVTEFDLGPKTLELFKEKISQAKTIFWSGPLGKIEEKEFQKGTEEVARAVLRTKAFKVAGGGEITSFLRSFHFASQFDHLSTGGSSLLAFLAGEKLPGIEALR